MTARIVASRRLVGPLAASLLLTASPLALAQERVGAAAAVNPDTNGTPPGAATRQLVIGQDVVHNERIATGPSGQTQILFLDQSSLTVSANADLTIDDFVFDPSTSTGKLAMSTTKGILRYVGGALSKNPNAVSMVTPSGTLGIRGGVFLLWQEPNGRLDIVLLYGRRALGDPDLSGLRAPVAHPARLLCHHRASRSAGFGPGSSSRGSDRPNARRALPAPTMAARRRRRPIGLFSTAGCRISSRAIPAAMTGGRSNTCRRSRRHPTSTPTRFRRRSASTARSVMATPSRSITIRSRPRRRLHPPRHRRRHRRRRRRHRLHRRPDPESRYRASSRIHATLARRLRDLTTDWEFGDFPVAIAFFPQGASHRYGDRT